MANEAFSDADISESRDFCRVSVTWELGSWNLE